MLKTFVISYRLKITYRANTILYALRQLPLVKKIIPSALYASTGLKRFATVVAFLYEIFGAFVGKIAYLLLMVFAILHSYVDTSNGSYLLMTYFALTLIGAFVNTGIFHATKDKETASGGQFTAGSVGCYHSACCCSLWAPCSWHWYE